MLFITAVPVPDLRLTSVVSLPKKLICNASASAPVGFYLHPPERAQNFIVEHGICR